MHVHVQRQTVKFGILNSYYCLLEKKLSVKNKTQKMFNFTCAVVHVIKENIIIFLECSEHQTYHKKCKTNKSPRIL